MRILFLDQFSEMGGAQWVLLDIVSAVLERGGSAHVAIPGNGPLVQKLEALGVGVSEIPCGPYRSGSKSIEDGLRFVADSLRQIQVINRIMERQPFDLVYVNGPRLLIAAAFASRGNAATIFHAHSLLGKGYAAKLARWSIDRTNAMVLACSNFVAAPLKHAAEIVPNGIADLRRREFYTPADWRVGIIGRISPEKGQAEFVQAAALLAPKFPTMRFVICGAPLFGDKAYADRVTESARGLPVEFLGWQSDVAAVLSQIDLLAVPSKDEGMGRVIIEAFSAEVPVVAFPEGGIPEVITDGATGFLTRESTAQALADRIAEIVQSPDVKTVVNNARAAWEQNYTIAAFQETIRNLIGAAVTRERASQRPYR